MARSEMTRRSALLLGGLAAGAIALPPASAAAWTTGADTVVGPDDGKHSTVAGAAGLPLHVVEYGPAGGRPLLLVHGANQSWLTWQFNVAGLAKLGFHVVTFDLRGHARSGADGDYRMPAYVADLTAIAQATRLSRPLVVGWSVGAFPMAGYLGTGAPRAALFVSTTVDPSEVFADARPDIVPALTTTLASRAGDGPFLDLCADPFRIPEPWRGQQLTENERQDPAQLRALIVQAGTYFGVPAAAIRNATVPILALNGDHDRLLKPEAGQRIAVTARHGTAEVIAGGGHAFFQQFPSVFNARVDAFARQAGV